MKRLVSAAVAVLACTAILAGLAGCSAGEMTTEEREISGVRAVKMSGIGTLELAQGTSESLEVEGPQRVVNALETRMQGDELVIEYDPGWFSGLWANAEDLVIRLSVTDLRRVALSGAGSIDAATLNVESLEWQVSGAGSVDAENVTTQQLAIDLSGAGGFHIRGGRAENQRVKLAGAGSYRAADMRSTTADVDVSGAGNAVIWVTERLDLRLSGAGNIEYYGEPRVNQSVTGAGRIKSLGPK